MPESIYGNQKETLPLVMKHIVNEIKNYNEENRIKTGHPVYEHLICRIKSEDSMREKLRRKGVEESPYGALRILRDSIGIRIVTGFVDDIYTNIDYLRKLPGCRVVKEKDYVRQAKENGYRSYHMILEYLAPFRDIEGAEPGSYFIEVQLRTIAMDCWASLEHEMKYKRTIANQQMLVNELKRCADELASCDITMQTIRNLIRESDESPGASV
ncbi:MAG: GTP pyrophosphokinase family protein [Eubacterium sp.]|nr:GTP pyrophosphokinase family protein [Eubacterium sp.]